MTTIEKLSCQELVELVTDYLEGALLLEERQRFEDHLAACTGCQSYLDQIRTTIDLVGRIEPGTLPPGAKSALLAAFRDWKSNERGLGGR